MFTLDASLCVQIYTWYLVIMMKIRVVARPPPLVSRPRLTLRGEAFSRKARGGQLTLSVPLRQKNLTRRRTGALATAVTLVLLLLLLRPHTVSSAFDGVWYRIYENRIFNPFTNKQLVKPFPFVAVGGHSPLQSLPTIREELRWRHIVCPSISRHNVADQYVFDEGQEKHQH